MQELTDAKTSKGKLLKVGGGEGVGVINLSIECGVGGGCGA